MNIKGKHLKLVRLIKSNFGILQTEVVKLGFEESMIESLRNKGVIAGINPESRLFIPLEIQNKTRDK